MKEKINFEIENIDLIDENPNSSFSIMSLDFFASGLNRHDMFVSEDTLNEMADTIKLKPIVWIYDRIFDDIGTHDNQEVPCGFIPQDSIIQKKVLADGRTMLNVTGMVWKKYSLGILNFFKRDNNIKPVSVELSVLETRILPDGIIEILRGIFEAVTVLGTYITPAIPDANATILSFSDEKNEYTKIYNREFSSNNSNNTEIDFTIPIEVKNLCQDGLDIIKEIDNDDNLNTVSFGIANYLVKNDKITLEKFKQFKKYIPKKFKNNDLDSLLFGGESGKLWFSNLSEQIKNNNIPKLNNEFSKDDLGKGSALEIDKSKEKLSTKPWENIDKTDLRNKILNASNYKSLVDDVYMLIESGWEDHPSSSLKYPIMELDANTLVYNRYGLSAALQRAEGQNETSVVSKIKEIYKKLDLDKPEDKNIKEEEKNMSDKKDFSINTQAYSLLVNALSVNQFNSNGQEQEKYWLQNFDAEFAYLYDYENAKRFSVPYTILNGEVAVNMDKIVEFADYKITSIGVSNDVEIPKTVEHVNMSLNEYADVAALLAFLQAETVQNEQMADETDTPDEAKAEDDDDVEMSNSVKTCMSEIAKGLDCNAGTVFASMLSYMKTASKKMAELSAANDVYMAENKALKESKAANESEKMNYEVTTVLNAAAEAGMPKDEIENCKVEAKNFSVDNIEAFKNMVLAKAFLYGGKKGKKDDSIRIPLPFSEAKHVVDPIWK